MEDIKSRWDQIVDYTDATHPTNSQESMGPAIQNLQTATKAAVGNENIDPEKLLAQEFPATDFQYTERDLSLYALGIGAARDATNPKELQFVYELSGDGFRAFPTYAVIFPFGTLMKLIDMEGIDFNPMMLLHGEQYLEVPKGKITA